MSARACIASGSYRWHLQCLRAVSAMLIALTLVLSLFHCPCCDCADGDMDTSSFTIAQSASDHSTKPDPLTAAPHDCHCLAHVTTMAPAQMDAVAVNYVASRYRLAAAPFPDAADIASPFEPPRA
jgi:hypothetical protein